MQKEQMVGAQFPPELVRVLELIEQSDRSTTVRRLLSQAIRQWEIGALRPAVRGWKTHARTHSSRCRGVYLGGDGLCPRQKSPCPIRPGGP